MLKLITRFFVKSVNVFLLACLLFAYINTITSAAAQNGTATPIPSGSNVALGKSAAQSSTLNDRLASFAIDGNTDGILANNSVSSTQMNAQAWWEVDLGSNYSLIDIRIWNRTDAGTESRLSNYYVLVSSVPFTSTDLTATRAQAGVSSYSGSASAGRPTTMNVNRSGRYVRVQLVGTDFLNLAEVEVYASGQASTSTATITPTLTPTMISGLGAGTYDDRNSNITYIGNWYTWNSPPSEDTYNKTLYYTNVVGASARVYFQGDSVTLIYSKLNNRGLIIVSIDGVEQARLNAYSPTTVWQAAWTSGALSSGTHVLTITHGGGGSIIDVDAVRVNPFPTATPTFTPTLTQIPTGSIVGPGIYDDRSGAISYYGGWLTWNSPPSEGTYNKTLYYTDVVGASANILFQGTSVTLIYSKMSNRGQIIVSIDGVEQTRLMAYSATTVWQATWTSQTLSSGSHILTITHGGSGSLIDVDAIRVNGPKNTVGTGTYDDRDSNMSYTGTWYPWDSPASEGTYNKTLFYTDTVGSSASLTFQGNSVTLIYSKLSNRGLIIVSIDGVEQTRLNAYSATTVWQATWTSGTLSSGSHILTITHGGNGSLIDVDAIRVNGN